MNYLKIFIVFMFLYNLTSCTKEEENTPLAENNDCINPQLPGDYFPAFPKSWWTFRNQHNEKIRYEISEDYQECDNVCRPVFTSIGRCIQESNLIYIWYCGQGQICSYPSPIYSLNVGDTMLCCISFSTFNETPWPPGGPEYIRYRRITIKLDTTIQLSNNVIYPNTIIVKEFNQFDSTHFYLDYFSKNVGLIKRDSVNMNDTSELIEILTLEDYYIGDK